jgi:hypothetical protein
MTPSAAHLRICEATISVAGSLRSVRLRKESTLS